VIFSSLSREPEVWPRKRNKTDLIAARNQRRESDRLLAEAKTLAHQIRKMREENHFAEAIMLTLKTGDRRDNA
jgi:hypothetical protein